MDRTPLRMPRRITLVTAATQQATRRAVPAQLVQAAHRATRHAARVEHAVRRTRHAAAVLRHADVHLVARVNHALDVRAARRQP